ncbi:MAG: hypothetical protein C4537_07995 [Acholeplasma sp.]|jgi:hypothetical protein|nr:MAG: hypothetical protein C4537_07995 [Acholeplasma sp.]
MTRKELKKTIKSKAMAFEVKDFSREIIEKAQHLPQTYVIEQERQTLRLKPIVWLSLSIMTSLFLIVLVLTDQTVVPPIPTIPETLALEDLEDAVALSTIQATSLIDVLDSELSNTSDYTTLFMGPRDRNLLIQAELLDVQRYLQTIEMLYASNENFETVDEAITNGFQREMRFKTKDFLDEENDYQVRYNQQINQETRHFMINGVIEVGNQSYPMTAEGTLGDKQFRMVASKDENNYVILEYAEEDGIYSYTIELIKNDLSIETVSITLAETDDVRTATLSFIDGESLGTYTFTMGIENDRKIILVSYVLDFDGDIEQGTMTIRILELPNVRTYSIIVEPEGRAAFTFSMGRMMPGMREPHGM